MQKNDSASYTYYTNTTDEWNETNSYKISTAVASDDWDYITFQQVSNDSGKEDTYDDLNELIEIIKPISKEAEFAWHMTWAYQSDSTHSAFPNYNSNQMTMYNAIISSVQNKIQTNNNIKIIIPVGTAIQNARTSFLGDTLTRDGYHLSYDIGRYIAGVEYLHGLTGVNVDKLTYKPVETSDIVRQIAIESAKNATINPYEITNSKFTISSLDNSEDYERVTLYLTKSAHYNSMNNDAASPPTLITERINTANNGKN